MDHSDTDSSDSEAILELEAEAAGVQHRLALAKLERKRKRSEQEPTAVPGPSRKKLKLKSAFTPPESDPDVIMTATALSNPPNAVPGPSKKKSKSKSKSAFTPPEPDADVIMTVTALSNPSHPSKQQIARGRHKRPKKPLESSEEEDETPIDPYWRKEYKKKPRGMHMTYPKDSNSFSASPWGLIDDNHGWNEFLGYIRNAVEKHFNVRKLWSNQKDKHESFYRMVVADYPVLTWQKGYFTISQTAAANLRYRVSLTDSSTSRKSRTSTLVTPSLSRSSAAPSETSSLTSIAVPDSPTVATSDQQETGGISDDLIDPALFPSAQVSDQILSMGGEDYGLPDMPIMDIPNQQLPGPSAPPGTNPATHFDGSFPSQGPVPAPGAQSRRTMVYQVSRDTDLSATSQTPHNAPSVELSSPRSSLVQASEVATTSSQVATANNPHLPTTSAFISSSDAASILLDINKQPPATHHFGTETTPETTLLDQGTQALVVPSAKLSAPKAKAGGVPRKSTTAKGAPQKASATPANKPIRRSTRGQK